MQTTDCELQNKRFSYTPLCTVGVDFEAVSTEVMFLPGETEAMVSVPLRDDAFPEPQFESFEAVLGASPGVFIGSPSFVSFTIRDDDPPLPSESVPVCVCVCVCLCLCVHTDTDTHTHTHTQVQTHLEVEDHHL